MTYQPPHKLTKSYIQRPKTTPFSGKTIGQSFNEMADRNPDKEMYVFYADKERKTCRQMQQESHQFAGGLLKLGLKKGDTICVWGGNHYEWLLAHFAALQLGVIVVYMQIAQPLDTQVCLLNKLAIKVVVLMRSPVDLFDTVCKIVPELLTNPADNLKCKSVPSLKYVIYAGTKISSGAFSVNDIMDMGKTVDIAKVRIACEKTDIDDRVAVYFTSGTTGLPKSVTHSHKSLYLYEFEGQLANIACNYDNKSTWAPRFGQVTSFGGISGQDGLLYPIYVEQGTTIMVGPYYDIGMFINAIQDERITGSIFLVHHLTDIVNFPNIEDYDLSSFEMAIFGGSALPASLLTRAKKLIKYVLLSYAATEGFAATQTPKDPMEIMETHAYPLVEGSEVKIIDDEGHVVPINTTGEVCFRSEMLFMYYWGDEEKTKLALSPSGWYHTGDLGTLDENGYIHVDGRKKEMIIKEGWNLAPGTLEMVIDQHPAVNNVQVVAVPDKRIGEEICACVRLHPSAKVTEDELKEFCKGKVNEHLVPVYVLFIEEEFPANEIGKFDRRKIAEQARISLGLQQWK